MNCEEVCLPRVKRDGCVDQGLCTGALAAPRGPATGGRREQPGVKGQPACCGTLGQRGALRGDAAACDGGLGWRRGGAAGVADRARGTAERHLQPDSIRADGVGGAECGVLHSAGERAGRRSRRCKAGGLFAADNADDGGGPPAARAAGRGAAAAHAGACGSDNAAAREDQGQGCAGGDRRQGAGSGRTREGEQQDREEKAGSCCCQVQPALDRQGDEARPGAGPCCAEAVGHAGGRAAALGRACRGAVQLAG